MDEWKRWSNNGGLGATWDSYKTYLKETFTNSKELENDTKKDNYLDQVIAVLVVCKGYIGD